MKSCLLLLTTVVVVSDVARWSYGVEPPPAAATTVAPLPPATPEKLPRWRGFNLLEKFHRDWSNRPFVEDDFRMIHELGFNFVRLPMDYRVWLEGDDWERFHEPTLREIDQAVEWGGKYGIHVWINFHRAPGYTVASPPEAMNLWTDPEAQRVCALHWALFARRYRGIPNERLAFNLFNEPANVEAADYVRVVREIVAAIRREDPDRLIVADGLQWGRQPVWELRELRLAQATRGYEPAEISHYRAGWLRGADQYPVPTWPIVLAHATLYGAGKRDWQAPLVIDGPFTAATTLRLRVGTVSDRAWLKVDADGRTLLEKDFRCGPDPAEWKKVEFRQEWNIYQNVADRDFMATIPAGAKQVRVHVTAGDWLQVRQLGLRADGDRTETSLALLDGWGQSPARLHYTHTAAGGKLSGTELMDRQWLRRTMIEPWQTPSTQGIGVMVGEFGAYNKTPHDVTLAWMEDCLANWRDAGWGWALWNFRGSFGILDSDRADVVYEDYQGHRLDRAMLELLRRN